MVRGEEMDTLGDRGGRCGGDDGTHCLRTPSHVNILFQVPGAGPIRVRRQLASVDSELADITKEMGTSIMGDWKGGRGCTYVGNVLHNGG